MKKIMLIALFVSSLQMANSHERDDIKQILKEVTYIKEVTKRLKHKYGKSRAKIRFNYDALVNQLNAIEYGTKQYLNQKANELHLRPPKPLVTPTYKVRKN